MFCTLCWVHSKHHFKRIPHDQFALFHFLPIYSIHLTVTYDAQYLSVQLCVASRTLNAANQLCPKLISSQHWRCSSPGGTPVATVSSGSPPRLLNSVWLCLLNRLTLSQSYSQFAKCGTHSTPFSLVVDRGVFAVLQHWLAACQCPVTWYHTDGHVSETQTRGARPGASRHILIRNCDRWGWGRKKK